MSVLSDIDTKPKTCMACQGTGYQCYCRDCHGNPANQCPNKHAWTVANPGRTKTCSACGGSGTVTLKPVIGVLKRQDVEVLQAVAGRLGGILQMNYDIEFGRLSQSDAANFADDIPNRLDALRLALGDLMSGYPVTVENL